MDVAASDALEERFALAGSGAGELVLEGIEEEAPRTLEGSQLSLVEPLVRQSQLGDLRCILP
jgi:hypothetical protein